LISVSTTRIFWVSTRQLQSEPGKIFFFNYLLKRSRKKKYYESLILQHILFFFFSGFTSDLSRPIELIMEVPEVVVKGPYSVDGRVLILPIAGKGNAEIRLSKFWLAIAEHFPI